MGVSEPTSDIASNPPAHFTRSLKIGPTAAVAAGVLLAVLVGGIGTARAAWQHITNVFSVGAEGISGNPSQGGQTGLTQDALTQSDLMQLDRLDPQRQAEFLLERAVGDCYGAVEQISSRVDQWQGKIRWNSQIANLTTTALTSHALPLRDASVQTEPPAY